MHDNESIRFLMVQIMVLSMLPRYNLPFTENENLRLDLGLSNSKRSIGLKRIKEMD